MDPITPFEETPETIESERRRISELSTRIMRKKTLIFPDIKTGMAALNQPAQDSGWQEVAQQAYENGWTGIEHLNIKLPESRQMTRVLMAHQKSNWLARFIRRLIGWM